VSVVQQGERRDEADLKRVLEKALADRSRLQILECIQKDVSNPGDIARKLDRHRSTVEKHLRVLLKAGIVQKVPSLTEKASLRSAT
jgi:DNA-binding transcriptional ArsR family regulator